MVKTPKRGKKEHQLIGQVLGKKKDKSYGGNWAKQTFYRLTVEIENKPEEIIKEILAFKDRIIEENLKEKDPAEHQKREQIWQDILEDEYFDRRLILYCSKYSSSYSLIWWKDKPLKSSK